LKQSCVDRLGVHGTIANRAEVHGQILCADWGFICQKSSDPTRIARLASVHGDTSYLIFACAHTGALYGVCGGSKSVPTKWLHIFLHRISHSAGTHPKSVLVDRGSELGRSTEFCRIADMHGYKTLTAGPDKSTMNSLGERPHQTIGNAIRSLLHASGLDLKYWNFAFHHFIRLFNFFPHGQRDKSPFEMVYGYKPDLSLLRVFGCNVYIRPPGRRSSKLDVHVIKGKFLGYMSTMKQIYYLEDKTHKIKIAAHAHFDEGLANVPLHDLPPYARQLRKALGHTVSLDDDADIWYWRREQRDDLPPGEFIPRQLEEFEQKFPILADPFLTSGMCDVSLAPNLLMRRSFGGTFVFLGGVALVMYLAKLQPTVVTSIGEGEFIQLVITGKKVKHVRGVMTDLGFPQNGPSPIFGDNISSIMMGNNVRPTDRTRHMDIRWFALQEWIHIDKDIILIHIPGEVNASDALSKALAWIKHYRHMSRAMGATGPIYLLSSNKLIPVQSNAIKALYVRPS
jgi:Integrase core domain.